MPDYHDEVFCSDDNGSGPMWVTAQGRTAGAAVAIYERFIGTLEGGCRVDLVAARIDHTADGPRVTLEDDGPIEMWQVE